MTAAPPRSESRTIHSQAPRAFWSSAATTAAAKPGVARSRSANSRLANNRTMRPYAKWHELGVRRADGAPSRPADQVKLWLPVGRRPGLPGWPEFSRGPFLQPVDQLHAGALPSRRPDPRRPALPPAVPRRRARAHPGRGQGNPAPAQRAGVQDRRHRRPHRQRHHRAILAFQKKVGMEPADGYAGLKLLARLRQGS